MAFLQTLLFILAIVWTPILLIELVGYLVQRHTECLEHRDCEQQKSAGEMYLENL